MSSQIEGNRTHIASLGVKYRRCGTFLVRRPFSILETFPEVCQNLEMTPRADRILTCEHIMHKTAMGGDLMWLSWVRKNAGPRNPIVCMICTYTIYKHDRISQGFIWWEPQTYSFHMRKKKIQSSNSMLVSWNQCHYKWFVWNVLAEENMVKLRRYTNLAH